MRKVLEVIWGVWKRKYFCKGDSTQNCPTGKSPRRREPLSCPGRAAALFALLRRAGTHIDAARWTPAQQRTAARCAADPGNAVAPPEVYQTCLMKECGESKFRSCPGRGAALFALLRRAGTHIDAARWTPAQQRTAARCAADPGNAVAPPEVYQTCLMKECGESTFRSCPGRGAAPFALLRRAGTHIDTCEMDPGSAAHRCALRC